MNALLDFLALFGAIIALFFVIITGLMVGVQGLTYLFHKLKERLHE